MRRTRTAAPCLAAALALCLVTAACSSGARDSTSEDSGTETTLAPVTSSSTTSTAPTTSVSPTAPSTSTTSTTTTVPPSVVTAPADSSVESTAAPTDTTTTLDPEKLAADEAEVLEIFRRQAKRFSGNGNYAIGVALAHHNEVVGTFSLGRTADNQALTADSAFRIASISKTLTAFAVMELVEQGRLRLDGTLAEQWEGTLKVRDPDARNITVRQLLQHTSCIPDLRKLFFSASPKNFRLSAATALTTPLICKPGGGYKYSNGNYAILGVLIEQVTDLPLEDAVRQLVLDPLGITTASISPTRVTNRSGARYYVSNNRRYMEALGPAGAWQMSPSDVARMLGALQPNSPESPLTRESRLAMQEPTAPPGQRYNNRYSLGLEKYGVLWGHTGTLQSVRTIAFMMPNGYSFAVLFAGERVGKAEELLRVFSESINAAKKLPKH